MIRRTNVYLNKNEEEIIDRFLGNLDEYDSQEMKLIWRDVGTITARFDTCFENDNELDESDAEYEEFESFVFEVICISGDPPVYITEDNYFCIDYHNFPDEILIDGIKIN